MYWYARGISEQSKQHPAFQLFQGLCNTFPHPKKPKESELIEQYIRVELFAIVLICHEQQYKTKLKQVKVILTILACTVLSKGLSQVVTNAVIT